jgi:moderate conductance mechanosensitive channel
MSVFWRRCFAIWLASLTSILILVGPPRGWAQTPVAQIPLAQIPIGQLPLPNLPPNGSENLPKGVQRLGGIEVIGVRFNDTELFKIVSPTVQDRTKPGNMVPVEVRARQIEENMQLVATHVEPDLALSGSRDYPTLFDPKTVRVSVEIVDRQLVLVAKDSQRPQSQVLMTITNRDAEYYGVSKEELAQRWRQKLQETLSAALSENLPIEAQRRLEGLLRWIAAVTVIGLSLLLIRRWLARWSQRLRVLQGQRQSLSPAPNPELETEEDQAWQEEFAEFIRTQFSFSQRINIIEFARWLILWSLILLWIWMIGLGLGVLPATRPYSKLLLSIPYSLLLLWFVMGFLNRLLDLGLNRFAKVWETENLLSFEDVQRRTLRITTIVKVLRDLKTFVIYLGGAVWFLGTLGIDTNSVIAVGAVAAFAVSLAFQNLIKDLLNGFLILLEDQYALGDVVTIGSSSGTVENINLRITQLRNAEGRMITIPNSLISQVENQTRTWARVDFRVLVAIETDIPRALEILHHTAHELSQDPHWQPQILEPPLLLGIEELAANGTQLHLQLKTQPHSKWQIERELRLRVQQAFAHQEIQIGGPK